MLRQRALVPDTGAGVHAVQCTGGAETATVTEDVQVGILGVFPPGRGTERRATTAGDDSGRDQLSSVATEQAVE